MSLATASDVFDDTEYLINDLPFASNGTTWTEVGMPEVLTSDIYNQLLVTNRLLGLLVAILIVGMVWSVMQFIMDLIRDNITNQF